MSMVCPECDASYEHNVECPRCGVRLVYEANPRGEEPNWQHTPWGRIIVGLLLAQGLAHGLQLVTRASLQATDEVTGEPAGTTIASILLLYALQGFSLLVGGTITGAGQRRGIFYGSFVGLVNGLVFLFMRMSRGEPLNEVVIYAQPVLHLAFGAAGGLIGTVIWKPLATVSFQPLTEIGTKPVPPCQLPGIWAGPISWIRVIAGAILVVAGVLWARDILNFILEAGEGKLEISSHLQEKWVLWEISAIAALIGAGVAGAGTPSGAKQGLLTGIAAVIVMIGMALGNPRSSGPVPPYLLGAFVALAIAGGWFGSQLFPPLVAGASRRRSRFI